MEINWSLIKKILITIVVIMLITAFRPVVFIEAGHRGIVLNFGAVSDTILDEGINWRIPIMQTVKELEVRIVKHTVKAAAYSKDIQTVDAEIALNYHLDAKAVNKLYQEIGTDYEVRIIDPAVQESIKAITAKFTAQELIEQRERVKDEIKILLINRLTSKYIVVDDFSIIDFSFSDQYEKAIEAKQVAQQEALQAENELKKVKIEAEQRVAKAEAEAKAIEIQAKAVTQQGGHDYVQLKAVEKWDGKLPVQMIPNATVPFIEIK